MVKTAFNIKTPPLGALNALRRETGVGPSGSTSGGIFVSQFLVFIKKSRSIFFMDKTQEAVGQNHQQEVWGKVLGQNEKLEFEFSVSDKYSNFSFIAWSIISIPLLFTAGLGVITFLISLFYFKFYLKRANIYGFTQKRILIHRGWLSTNMISVDYDKITDIRVSESFMEKSTKTGRLKINTSGSGNTEIILDRIESPYEIKKKLDDLIDKQHRSRRD